MYARNVVMRRGVRTLMGLALGLPLLAGAEPNANSEADIAVCLEDAATVRVCSSKELSNVVLQCTGDPVFHKVDDLDDTESPFPGLVSPYEGLFTCPDGDVVAVFVKSGSAKFSGSLEGLPPGAGAFFGLDPVEDACPVDCPAPGKEHEEDEGDGEDETPTDEIPQ